MNVLLDYIEDDFPAAAVQYQPRVYDISDYNQTVYELVLLLGNGLLVEARAEGDSDEAIQAITGLFTGVGGFVLQPEATHADFKQQVISFYQPGDQIFCLPLEQPQWFFVNPTPRSIAHDN